MIDWATMKGQNMAATETTVKISMQPGKGYKKFVGGKMFYLGHDLPAAQRLAWRIVERWKERKFAGGKVWEKIDMDWIASCKAEGDYCITPLEMQEQILAAAARSNRLMPQQRGGEVTGRLYQALDEFVARMRGSAATPLYAEEVAYRVAKVKAVAEDMPLTAFGADAIETIINAWLSETKKGKWAKDTCGHFVSTFRQFTDWLDRSENPAWANWVAPHRFEKLFAVKHRITPPATAKRAAKRNAPYLTVEQLKALYGAASPRLRLLILLGLNCGFTQGDCATLTECMVVEHKGRLYIDRDRHKTQAFRGGFLLWAETAELLRAELGARKMGDVDAPILLTEKGKPLVWVTEKKRRVDSVLQAWNRLRLSLGWMVANPEKRHALAVKPGYERTSFKWLRKWASQAVRNFAGKDIAEAWMMHTDKGVVKNADNENAYNRFQDWAGLDAAVTKLRETLEPMFPDKPKTA